MKLHATYVALVIILVPTVSLAEDFNVEEQGLAPLPKNVESTIRNDKSFAGIQNCSLIGKAVNITGQNISGFVATTKDGCAWGAATGPIWVVHDAKQNSKMVLNYGGNSLTLGTQIENGFRNITITEGTAGWHSESQWKFDGTSYAKITETSDVNGKSGLPLNTPSPRKARHFPKSEPIVVPPRE